MSSLSPPYKIVVVLQDLEFGGTQRYALNLLLHMDKKLFDPELWVLRGGDDMLSFAQKTGVPVHRFSASGWVTPLALLRFFRALVKHKPVYLYPLTVVPNIWGRLFGRILKVPVIVSSYRNLYARQYESLLHNFSSHIICNSKAIEQKLLQQHKVDINKISVVVNGVDSNYFLPDPGQRAHPPLLLFAGRLVPQKDPLTLLKAFYTIVQTVPEAKLVLAGNGSLRSQLEQFIEAHSLEKSVSLLPGTAEIRTLMQQASLFLLPSLYEGSPNILIEAMACELPVVATRASGVPELIEHGVNGHLVAIGDHVAMANAVLELLQNQRLRGKMGRAARKKVENEHELAACVRATESVLLKLL